jgi:hypothetical protein
MKTVCFIPLLCDVRVIGRKSNEHLRRRCLHDWGPEHSGPRAMFLRWVGLSMRATARVVPNGTLSKRTAVYLNEQTYLVVKRERDTRSRWCSVNGPRDGTTCYLRAQL